MEFPEFVPIRPSDAARLRARLAGNRNPSCECSAANLLLWAEIYGVAVAEYQGTLAVLGGAEKVLHFPIGEALPPASLAALAGELTRRGLIEGLIYDVPPDYFTRFPEAAEFFTESADPGQADYLYELSSLAALSGPKLRKKRNLIQQFKTANPAWSLEPIVPQNIPVAAALADTLNHRLAPAEFLEEETFALRAGWAHFCDFGLEGVLLYAAPGCAVGFSVYSAVTEDCFDIHFEKADHACKGAPQMLTWQLALRLAERGRWMNREQDMNEPGLRRAKESLDPARRFDRRMLRLLSR